MPNLSYQVMTFFSCNVDNLLIRQTRRTDTRMIGGEVAGPPSISSSELITSRLFFLSIHLPMRTVRNTVERQCMLRLGTLRALWVAMLGTRCQPLLFRSSHAQKRGAWQYNRGCRSV